jgi:uncharacterized protein YhfF
MQQLSLSNIFKQTKSGTVAFTTYESEEDGNEIASVKKQSPKNNNALCSKLLLGKKTATSGALALAKNLVKGH